MQFTGLHAHKLGQLRGPVEKQLKEAVKIAKWCVDLTGTPLVPPCIRIRRRLPFVQERRQLLGGQGDERQHA
jgi:hypothetical protein